MSPAKIAKILLGFLGLGIAVYVTGYIIMWLKSEITEEIEEVR